MDVAGRWRKVSSSSCGERYPSLLELEPAGRYTGTNDEGSAFHPIWDRGGWESAGTGRLRISTANDAQVVYTVELAGDSLAFVDPEGCRIEYVRVT